MVWLLVVPATESKLSLIASCLKLQGFGYLMLIMLTKRSAYQFLHNLEHAVYQEPLICGFVRINDCAGLDFELLPKSF